MVGLEGSALGQKIDLFCQLLIDRIIFPKQDALKRILSSRRVYPFSKDVSAQVIGCIHASSAYVIAAFADMIEQAFH